MKQNLKKVLSFLVAAVFVLGLAACDTETTGESGAGTVGGNLVRVYRSTTNAQTPNLNPANYSMAVDDDWMSMMFKGFLERDNTTTTYTYIGAMAEDLPEVSEDGLTWTFHVREGMTWTDGTPINAYTFEYTVKMFLDPKLANRYSTKFYNTVSVENALAYFKGECDWEDVGCKAIDEYTIVFTLDIRPLTLVGIQTLGTFYPIHEPSFEAGFNASRTENSYGTNNYTSMPVNGQYKFTYYEDGQWFVFELNKDYVLASRRPVERYEYRYVTQATVRDQLFELNMTDYISVSSANYDKYKEDPRLLTFTGGDVYGIYINMLSDTKPILRDNNFRKALYYGMDRKSIAEGVYKVYVPAPFIVKNDAFLGDATTGNTYSYRSTDVAKANVPDNYGYNPELAREYFDKAYKANGSTKIELTMLYFDTNDTHKMMAEVVQEQWMTLFGKDKFDLKLQSITSNVAYEKYRTLDYEIGYGYTTQSSTNPWQTMFNVWSMDNIQNKNSQMRNEEFHELATRVTKGDLLHASQEEKLAALARLEAIILDEVPWIPMVEGDSKGIYRERIHLLNNIYAPGIGFVFSSVDPIRIDGLEAFDGGN